MSLHEKIQERITSLLKKLEEETHLSSMWSSYQGELIAYQWVLIELEKEPNQYALGYADGRKDSGYWSGRSEKEIQERIKYIEIVRTAFSPSMNGWDAETKRIKDLEWVLSKQEKKEPLKVKDAGLE